MVLYYAVYEPVLFSFPFHAVVINRPESLIPTFMLIPPVAKRRTNRVLDRENEAATRAKTGVNGANHCAVISNVVERQAAYDNVIGCRSNRKIFNRTIHILDSPLDCTIFRNLDHSKG